MPDQIPARCDLCLYSRKVRLSPVDIRTALVCKRLPPTTIVSAGPAKGQSAIGSLSPIVQPTDMCYEFQHDEAKQTEPPLSAANEPGN